MTARPKSGRLRVPRPPAVAEDEWDAGLRAIAVRRPGVPLVEIRLFVPATAEHLLRAAGPTVLAESMLAGTATHDREQLAKAVESLGGHVAVGFSGDGLSVRASALATNFRPLVALLADVLSGASYPADEVQADRDRLANEVMIALSQPEVVAHDELYRSLFGSHPYGAATPRPATIRRVGPGQLRTLHPELVTATHAALVIVGDVRPNSALGAAKDLLSPWSAGRSPAPAALPGVPELRPGGIRVVAREGSVQSNIRIGGRAVSRSDPDWPAASLANMVFGGMFASRLVTNLRERNGYTYSPRSLVDHRRVASSLAIQADVGADVTARALVETRFELGRMAVAGVTDEELESARRYGVGSFTILTATQSGQADTLAALVAGGLGPGYLASHPRALAGASKAEVDAAARRLFAPAGLVTVVVGDADQIVASLSAIDEVTVKATSASK